VIDVTRPRVRIEVHDLDGRSSTYELVGQAFVEQSDGTAVIVVMPDSGDATTVIQMLKDRLVELEVVHRDNLERTPTIDVH
jgi:hypothetical protein